MKVLDYERQLELDPLRWKVLTAAAAVTAATLKNRYSHACIGQDLEDELDAAVCAYAAKLIEPITCKACGQVIKPEDATQVMGEPGKCAGHGS